MEASARSLMEVLMLAAGIRGFLEAAADTFQSFSAVPSTLAESPHGRARSDQG